MSGEPNVREAVPFFLVANLDASLKHYVDGLGFRATKTWIDGGVLRWCWLELGGMSLMLQQRHDAWRPDGKVGEGVTICVMCGDAPAFYREVTARGVRASRPFVGNGLWVTTVIDPDGYRLDFESPTNAPEESEDADAPVAK